MHLLILIKRRLAILSFNDCTVIGCSTAGEIISGELLKNSVVAMAINFDIVSDVKVELIQNVYGFIGAYIIENK